MLIIIGDIYIADRSNHRIRKVVVSTGIITTIAGSSSSGYSGDNRQATAATLFDPSGIAVDLSGSTLCQYSFTLILTSLFLLFLGNYYIADRSNHRVRKVVVSTGIITTIAGNSGTGSYSGDGGAATAAGLYYPHSVALDSAGSFLFTFLYIKLELIYIFT